MCFLLMTFIPVQKLCVNIYIYIYAISATDYVYSIGILIIVISLLQAFGWILLWPEQRFLRSIV